MTRTCEADGLSDLVTAARAGDVAAYGRLVQATQAMSLAVAVSVLRDPAGAEDAVQEAYLRAYRRLGDLEDPAAFPGWLRRIVITAALNLRRVRRVTLLDLDDVLSTPVLDETEKRWSDAQRHRLAAALLTLSAEERRICDRRYHGGWSLARLAEAAGMTETTMRKRLQRIRNRLRQYIEAEEIEMVKERGVDPEAVAAHLPGKIVELLASPRLTDIPENPVGGVLRQLRDAYPEFNELPLPEIVDVAERDREGRNVREAVRAAPRRCEQDPAVRPDAAPVAHRAIMKVNRFACGPPARSTAYARPTPNIWKRFTSSKCCGWMSAKRSISGS